MMTEQDERRGFGVDCVFIKAEKTPESSGKLQCVDKECQSVMSYLIAVDLHFSNDQSVDGAFVFSAEIGILRDFLVVS